MFPSRRIPGVVAPSSRSRRRDICIPFLLGVVVCAAVSFLLRGPLTSSSADAGSLRTAHLEATGSGVDAMFLSRLEASVSRIELAALDLEERTRLNGKTAAAVFVPPLQAVDSEAVFVPLQAVDSEVVVAAAHPPTTRPRPIVLGMAKGIDLAGAYRFVRSLRAATHDVEAVIFTDAESLAADPALVTMYATYGATVVTFDLERDVPAGSRGWHPSTYRWLLMRDWLHKREKEGGGGARVFFVDVRDTVFQTDVFAAAAAAGVDGGFVAFQENRPTTIAQCGWNSGWVKDCFGPEGLRSVGGFVISCSGTSLAAWRDALAYADLMADTMLAKPLCERNGIDQGMHNYFVYSGELAAKVSALHLIPNEDGFVATVQSMPTLVRDRSGRVMNAGGKPYAVVHQYDRSTVLKQQYAEEFVWLGEAELRGK